MASGAQPATRRGPDPFGTADLRRTVLAAWGANPDRFREDANAEADLALGAYRDRVVVELAQNAADAAALAGTPGRLLLHLDPGVGPHGALVAANTGAPLDAAGVRALASLRASAKRAGGSVGRFGVGFTAVLALTDAPSVRSTRGGVRFSRELTERDLAAATGSAAAAAGTALAGLAAEVSARRGALPVLRLPHPLPDRPAGVDDVPVPASYDTVVVLPLRDGVAAKAAAAALAATGDGVLLALPALAEVVVRVPGEGDRVVADVERRWWVLRRSGAHRAIGQRVPDVEGALSQGPGAGDSGAPAAGPAHLGVEERARADAGWSLAWALPREHAGADQLPGVLLAPTPTDVPLPWPAALVATLPLEASRRAIAPSPATEVVVAAAARAYAELLQERAAAGQDVLGLVPDGLPAGPFDAALREALMEVLPSTRLLRPAGPPALAAPAGPAPPGGSGSGLLRAVDAVLLDLPLGADPAALSALAPVVGGLVATPTAAGHRALLRRLGASTASVGDLVDALPTTSDSATWRAWAVALAPAALDPLVREQLATMPVPLAGGAGVRGARGLLLPAVEETAGAPGALAEALAVLARHGVRVVDPAVTTGPDGAACAALLQRLGAVPASARAVLDHPAVAGAVLDVADDPDADAVHPDALGPDALGPGPRDRAGDLAGAVLALAARATDDGDLRPGDLPWAQELLLRDVGGALVPAAGLVLPGSPAAALLDPDEVGEVDPALVARWGAAALEAVGVAAALAVLRFADVDPDDPPDALLDLDGAQEWLDAVAPPDGGVIGEVVAVRDLDLVVAQRLPLLLRSASTGASSGGTDPALREAVLTPAHGGRGAGTAREPGAAPAPAPSYTAWWLGRELGATGRADPSAGAGLAAVLRAPVPEVAACDPALRAALGLVREWSQVPPAAWQGVVDAPGDGAALPAAADLLALWRALATAAPDLVPPEQVVALGPGGVPVLASADDVVVVDGPRWRQLPALGPQVVVAPDLAAALADVLDLDLASERGAGARVRGIGRRREVPASVREALAGCPAAWTAHDRLELHVPGSGAAEVSWWVQDVQVHASTPGGLARGLAEVTGAWPRRLLLAQVLTALADGDDAAASQAIAEEAAG